MNTQKPIQTDRFDKWRGFKYSPQTGNIYRNFSSGGNTPGVITNRTKSGYVRVGKNGKQFRAHRVAFEIMNRTPLQPSIFVDHINGKRADNRWHNIRLSSYLLNNRNRNCHRDGRLLGAKRHKASGKFGVSYWHNNKSIWLGLRETEESAHALFLEADAHFSGKIHSHAINDILFNKGNLI